MNGDVVVIVIVTTLDEYEQLLAHPGSISGSFDAGNVNRQRGEVIFGTFRAAAEARNHLHPLN